MIAARELCKRFGRLTVLKDVTFSVRPAAVTGFLGPNASGKSTLIKCVLGLVRPDSGRVLVDGEAVGRRWNYRKRIGYMPQITRFPDNLKVRELLAMLTDLRGSPVCDDELIEAFELPDIMERKLGVLSGGTRQKINAAIAFMFDPEVLILDEPTAGLDPVSITVLKDKINRSRNDGKTVVMTSHNMQEVEELAQRIIFLLDGAAHFDGPVLELKTRTTTDTLERAIVALMEGGR